MWWILSNSLNTLNISQKTFFNEPDVGVNFKRVGEQKLKGFRPWTNRRKKLPLIDMEYFVGREKGMNYQDLLLDIYTLRYQLDIWVEISRKQLDMQMGGLRRSQVRNVNWESAYRSNLKSWDRRRSPGNLCSENRGASSEPRDTSVLKDQYL